AGEQGEILLEVNTLTQPAGPNAWHLTVCYREDGQERVRDLAILADLVTEVKVEPPKLTLSTDGTLRHEVVVTDLRPVPLRVTHAQCSSPYLAAQVRPSEGGPGWRVSVVVAESMPEGRHEEVLSIVTDDPAYRELRVPVTVVKRSRQGV